MAVKRKYMTVDCQETHVLLKYRRATPKDSCQQLPATEHLPVVLSRRFVFLDSNGTATFMIHSRLAASLHPFVTCCCLFAGVWLNSGCGGDSTNPNTAKDPFAGVEVAIAVPKQLEAPLRWQILLDEWSARTGASYRLHEYTFENETDQFSSTIESSDHLLFFPLTNISDVAIHGTLTPIPEQFQGSSELAWLDLFQGLRDQVCSLSDAPTVLPISSSTLVCYYRKDLLEAAGLSAPASWQDYQALLENLDHWAPGLTAAEPWGEQFRATMFLARSVPYAKHRGHYSLFLDSQTGTPLIDSPGFVHGIEMAKSALSHMPTNVLEYSPQDCRREIVSGRAALAIAYETGSYNSPTPFGPQTSGTDGLADARRPDGAQIGFCRLPGAEKVFNQTTHDWEQQQDRLNYVPLTGFDGLCAAVGYSPESPQSAAAWNLLKFLTINELDAAFPQPLKGLVRESQTTSIAGWVGEDLSADEQYDYVSVVSKSLRDDQLVACLPFPERHIFRNALTDAISRILIDGVPADSALRNVAQEWEKLTEQEDRRKVVSTYRRRLGLSPLRQ